MNAPKKKPPTPAVEPAAGEEQVTLLKEHTHHRVKHKAGDKLTVDASTAEWLREHGVIAKAAAAETTKE